MNAATPEQIRIAIESGWAMRHGRALRRTLYLVDPYYNNPTRDICVGIVDSEELAEAIILRWNLHMNPHSVHHR